MVYEYLSVILKIFLFFIIKIGLYTCYNLNIFFLTKLNIEINKVKLNLFNKKLINFTKLFNNSLFPHYFIYEKRYTIIISQFNYTIFNIY